MTAGAVPGADAAAAPERRARTLDDQRVKATLARLFAEKRAQRWRVMRHVVRTIAERIAGVRPSLDREVEQLTGFYASVTPQQGEFLYLVARSVRATRIVEYGTSVGVSATYLGAAVRDNGGGVVIGSELHPAKHATAIRNLAEAGSATW